jgi:hypothetical protein
MSNRLSAVTIAWLITAVYYFFQYSLRSAPSVMIPELGTAFGLEAEPAPTPRDDQWMKSAGRALACTASYWRSSSLCY